MRAIFQVQAPGGLIFGGAIKRRVFCVTGLGGLYLEGPIYGGAYFQNFMVDQFSLRHSGLHGFRARSHTHGPLAPNYSICFFQSGAKLFFSLHY